MTLLYIRNAQMGRHEDFIAQLEAQGREVECRNPDYWRGRVDERASLVFTDFPKVRQAYQEAGIETRRVTHEQRSIEELARLKGATIDRRGGGWTAVITEEGEEQSFRDEENLRTYLDNL